MIKSTPSSPLRAWLLATGSGLAVLASACSGGGSGSSSSATGATMAVVSCSLGCSNGLSGVQVGCGVTNIGVNQEISVLFSNDVNIASVDKNSFQVTEVTTGKSPTGTFFLDPLNTKRLVFRPQLTFDSSGNPIFGLNQNSSYTVTILGVEQDPIGPYVMSMAGKPNQTRLLCTVAATEGISDPVPGPPTAEVLVDVVTGYDMDGNPSTFDRDVQAQGAENVWRDTTVTINFDDVMNPATLVNPVTGESSFIRVSVDPDGNILDPSDQIDLMGTFGIFLDQEGLTTKVTFDADQGLPSAGTGATKRKVVVFLSPAISDLGGSALTNPGQTVFTPEVLLFDPVLLPGGTGEDFVTTEYIDLERSGALNQSGTLLPGVSGGAGYLGDLYVETGEILDLCTEADCVEYPDAVNTFENINIIPLGSDNVVPGSLPSITVTDGVFQFTTVTVRAGAELTPRGVNPLRLFARGELILQGLVDVAGAGPSDVDGHESDGLDGGTGGKAGAGGQDGGDGGDVPDYTGNTEMLLKGAETNPGAEPNGADGGGVAGSTAGAGFGGPQWPVDFPTGILEADWAGMDLSNVLNCSSEQSSASGGGGAYATDGGAGSSVAPLVLGFPGPQVPTPDTPGGSSAEIDLSEEARTLDPELGFLRGGAGGGGGGAGLHMSKSNGTPLNCSLPLLGAPELEIDDNGFVNHSAAGGGGSGGAVQLNAGGRLSVEGLIAATGGDGGSSYLIFLPGSTVERDRSAGAGGGGAGGAALLQSPNLQISSSPGRIDVSGGIGGTGIGTSGIGGDDKSRGGDGGIGLVRLESDGDLSAENEAPKLTPYDPMEPDSVTFLRVGEIAVPETGPEALSGMQSCWMKPTGNFFSVDFVEDNFAEGTLGWDMTLRTTLASPTEVSFRGENPLTPGGNLETLLGTDLLGSQPAPIVVRFQGIRSISDVVSFCNVDLEGGDGSVLPESLTGWVRHPAELNTYWEGVDGVSAEEAGRRKPNMVRYQIIFDRSSPFLPAIFDGVNRIVIVAQPD